jgi:hypothetical protein
MILIIFQISRELTHFRLLFHPPLFFAPFPPKGGLILFAFAKYLSCIGVLAPL